MRPRRSGASECGHSTSASRWAVRGDVITARRERSEVLFHEVEIGLPGAGEHGLVEAVEADLTCQVGDHRRAVHRCRHETIEALAQGVGLGARLGDGSHRSSTATTAGRWVATPSLRLEDPIQRVMQGRAGFERGHAVMGDRPPEIGHEPGREPFAVGVERAEVCEEVLLRAAYWRSRSPSPCRLRKSTRRSANSVTRAISPRSTRGSGPSDTQMSAWSSMAASASPGSTS